MPLCGMYLYACVCYTVIPESLYFLAISSSSATIMRLNAYYCTGLTAQAIISHLLQSKATEQVATNLSVIRVWSKELEYTEVY